MSKVKITDKFINVETGEYPVSLYQLKREQNHVSLPDLPNITTIEHLGYKVVKETEQPTGDVVTAGQPELIDGDYYQSWEVRDFNETELRERLEQKKQQLLVEVEQLKDRRLKQGTPVEFGDVIEHIQLRTEDRANMAGLRIRAEAYVSDGEGDKTEVVRTYEDTNHVLTCAEVVELTNKVFDGYTSIMNDIWVLKDLIKLAETEDDLPEIR